MNRIRAKCGGVLAALLLELAGPAWAGTVVLVSPTSRAVLCDGGEGCAGGVCQSDGATVCSLDSDCPRCVTVQNNDIAMCASTSAGPTIEACHWSLFFDGEAAGLDAGIRALDVLPDGSLVLRAAADNSVPDIAGVNHKDLVRFLPKDAQGHSTAMRLPYRNGEWDLFFDGDAVERNSGGRLIEGLDVASESCRDVNDDGAVRATECDLLFSPVSAGTLGRLDLQIEDIVRCRPTALSEGGAIEACEYSLFYDASSVNVSAYPPPVDSIGAGSWRVGGTTAFALQRFDPLHLTGDLYFLAGNTSSLPKHQPPRDLLLNRGTIGPVGMCAGTAEQLCLSDSDCGGAACLLYLNPVLSQPTTILFDGSATMSGETITAVALLDDGDDDGIPDAVDNCPSLPNAAHCANDAGRSCSSESDCVQSECLQEDVDQDGIGDACDRCPGRNDAECTCGNFVVDGVGETCDLGDAAAGGLNGVSGSGCSGECHRSGVCTGSGGSCAAASECPAGEGCCGNGAIDGAAGVEQCDDGNGVADDGCDLSCRVSSDAIPLPVECQGVIGPRLTPTFVRSLRFRKQRVKVAADRQPHNFSKWSSRGEFPLAPGLPFDPDTQRVDVIFSQDRFVCSDGPAAGQVCTSAADCGEGRCSSALYRAALLPGAFVQGGLQADRPRWDFEDQLGRTIGAPAWTEARFTQRLATIHRRLNEVKYKIKGRGDRSEPQVSIQIDPFALTGPPTRIRQTIVVGGLCTTQTLVCESNKTSTTLTCYSRAE